MYYTRDFQQKITDAAASTPAIVITGARQTGKTTLLKKIFSSHHYVSLDRPSLAESAEKDPDEFFRANPPPIVIDEVQYAPKIFRHIKRLIDEDRDRCGQFILTGSQKFSLMREVSDSLAGRCLWFELEGFNFSEISLIDSKIEQDLSRLITTGGYPELWTNPKINRTDYFSSYLATYIERDVRQIINITNLRDFERFVRATAARSGQLLDKSALAKDVGISPKTASAWLSVLEASNIVAILEPWFANIGKRIIKSPKVYFCDSGLCSFLLNLNADDLASSTYAGALWETYVYSELRKKIRINRELGSLWFYRDTDRSEIDFVRTAGNHMDLIEAKWTENPDAKDCAPIRKFMEFAKSKNSFPFASQAGWIACRALNSYPLGREDLKIRALDVKSLSLF